MATKFEVIANIHRYNTTEVSSDDEWARPDTAASIDIQYLRIVDDNNSYYDVILPNDYNPDLPIYLLWANYDTGDSFGRDENNVEYIDVFQSKEKAEAAQLSLQVASEKYNEYSAEYIRDNDEKIKVHIPWKGYFEHLNYIEIECLDVKKN